MSPAGILRFCSRALFGALVLAGALRGAEEPAASDVVKLPVYTVTDARELPPPERWSYARFEGFELLSNASERQTRDIVRYFQRFASALDVVWPGVRKPTDTPVVLILCGRGVKFEQFVPEGAETDLGRGKVSLTLGTREQTAIVVAAATKVLDSIQIGSTISDAGSFDTDVYQQLSREYVRVLLGGDQAKFPPWFVEGIAQILMTMEISAKEIKVGDIEDPNLVDPLQQEWDRGFAGALKGRALLPMSELLGMAATAKEVRNPIGSTWAKQATAFVHWGLYGDRGRHQKPFLQFVVRSTREPVTEAMFQECFKMNYARMLEELTGYVKFTPHKWQGFRAEKGQKLVADPPPLTLRDATEAEVGRMKGDTLRLAGHETEARAAMLAAYIRGERDPQLLGAFGLVELARGDAARAEKFLDVAAQAKIVRPRVYVELARLRFARTDAARPEAKWDAAEVAAVAGLLQTARAQPPPRSDVYELLVATWVRAVAAPDIEQLKVADEGIRRFPRDTRLIYDAAILMQRGGRLADAAMIAQHGITVAADDPTREKLQALRATLPPPATATPAMK